MHKYKYDEIINSDIIEEIENNFKSKEFIHKIDIFFDRGITKSGRKKFRVRIGQQDIILLETKTLIELLENKEYSAIAKLTFDKYLISLIRLLGFKKKNVFFGETHESEFESVSEWSKNEEYLYKHNEITIESLEKENKNLPLIFCKKRAQGVNRDDIINNKGKLLDELQKFLNKINGLQTEYTRYDLINYCGVDFITYLCFIVGFINNTFNVHILNEFPNEKLVNPPPHRFKYNKQKRNRNITIQDNNGSCKDYEKMSPTLLKLLNKKLDELITKNKCLTNNNQKLIDSLKSFEKLELSFSKDIQMYKQKIKLCADSDGYFDPNKMSDEAVQQYLIDLDIFSKQKNELHEKGKKLILCIENLK